MCIRILPLLISGIITITFADSAVQTDWSGGDGILGPVLTWGNEFYQFSTLDWTSFPDSLVSLGFLEHTVDGDFFAAQSCIQLISTETAAWMSLELPGILLTTSFGGRM